MSSYSVHLGNVSFLRIPFWGFFRSPFNYTLSGGPTNFHGFRYHLSAVISMGNQYNLVFESMCFVIKQT